MFSISILRQGTFYFFETHHPTTPSTFTLSKSADGQFLQKSNELHHMQPKQSILKIQCNIYCLTSYERSLIMIQLSDYITTPDSQVNHFISAFISNRIYDIIEPMQDYTIDGLKHFFPPRYRHKKMLPVIEDFCKLLKSEHYYTLPLIMEYVLFKSLQEEISHCEEFDIPTISAIPQHDEIKGILQKDGLELESESLEEFVMFVEDLEMYPEILYDDWDFEFLDDMTELQLYKSSANSYLGIGTKESIVYVPGSVAY